MIPTTPEQRIDCYQKAIDLLTKKKNGEVGAAKFSGMCITLKNDVCNDESEEVYGLFVRVNFPELWEQRPVGADYSSCWYEDSEIDKRIAHLEKAIDLVKERNSHLTFEEIT